MARKADGILPPLVQVQPPDKSGGRLWVKPKNKLEVKATMKKYTQKELRSLVSLNVASDLTHCSHNEATEFIKNHTLEKVGYSTGTCGINGGLVQDIHSGELFAIVGRTVALFTLF